MRVIVIGITLALTASAPLAATVQAPVTAQPLAQGEVLVEVNAMGLVTTHADRATMSFPLTGSSDNEADAQTQLQQEIAAVRATLRSLGVADADIRVQPATIERTDAMAPDMNDMMEVNATEAVNAAGAMSEITASAQIEIVVRNVDRIAAIQAAMPERGAYATYGLTYALNDESGPRREARTRALRQARADAESYAAGLNMRVVRVIRVTERLGVDVLGMGASEGQVLTRLFAPPSVRNNGPEVQTVALVGVDFALAPR